MNRREVLETALKFTMSDRNTTYGDPVVQMGLAEAWADMFFAHTRRYFPPAERQAIRSVFLKLSRLACGSVPHPDSYVDIAAFAAIAQEAASRSNPEG